MAPEVMNSGKRVEPEGGKLSYYGYSHQADWWSLGIIAYSMKFLRKPFIQSEVGTSSNSTPPTMVDNSVITAWKGKVENKLWQVILNVD